MAKCGERMIEVKNEIYRDVPIRWMKRFHRYEPVILDHTARKQWKTCPRLYFFNIVLGFNPKGDNIVLTWGSAYHKFRERLEILYGVGHERPPRFDEEKAQAAFAQAAMEATTWFKKHAEAQPPGGKWDFMTEGRLVKSFITAFKHWKREKLQGAIEVIAVEQPFNVQVTDGLSISGRADQIIRWLGKIWGRDFKTTSKDTEFVKRNLEPSDQFTGYTLGEALLSGESVQGQFVEYLYNAKPTKKDEKGPEITETQTSRTKWQLEEFAADLIQISKHMAISREEDRYPMHEIACPFCPFHSVCRQPTEGAMMAQLEAHYTVRPWDNARIGEEEK